MMTTKSKRLASMNQNSEYNKRVANFAQSKRADGRPYILYEKNEPNHYAIGKYYKSWDGYKWKCLAHEHSYGFWMVMVHDDCSEVQPRYMINIAEKALEVTFHERYPIKGTKRINWRD